MFSSVFLAGGKPAAGIVRYRCIHEHTDGISNKPRVEFGSFSINGGRTGGSAVFVLHTFYFDIILGEGKTATDISTYQSQHEHIDAFLGANVQPI